MSLFSTQQISSLPKKRLGLSDPPMRSPCWPCTKGQCLTGLRSAAINSHTQCPEHFCPCLLSHLSGGEPHSSVSPDIKIFSIVSSHFSFPQTYYTQIQLLPHTPAPGASQPPGLDSGDFIPTIGAVAAATDHREGGWDCTLYWLCLTPGGPQPPPGRPPIGQQCHDFPYCKLVCI